jgi:hypothetical protein
LVEDPDKGKPIYPEINLSQCHFVTWTDLGSNPSLLDKRPSTNCLSHGTAKLKLAVLAKE